MKSFLLVYLMVLTALAETQACICTKELRPVCGSDGITYANPCLARCHGATILYKGKCEVTVTTLCPCTKELRPVCGSDGITYANPCLARCRGAEILYKGRCGDPLKEELGDPVKLCPCTKELRPVCGSDGITYANPCLARCRGAEILYKGRCGDPLKEELGDPVKLCPCTKELRPVCGSDGITYANPCLARCRGAEILYKGKC